MKPKHPIRPHLRAWRDALKISQVALANELGVSHTSVMRWESGESGVSDATFAAIAKAYGITVAELSAPPAEAGKARELHRLLTAIPTLDEGALATLASLAERLGSPEK